MKQPYAKFISNDQTGKDGRLIFPGSNNPFKKARWKVELWAVFSNGEREDHVVRVREPVRFKELLKQAVEKQVEDLLPIGAEVTSMGFMVWEM